MPVISCGNGKYRIGNGKCMFDSKAKAEAAYRGYLAKKDKKEELKYELISEIGDLKKMEIELNRIKKLIKNDN